ncbi:Hydroxyethylthiazole kinase family-domain-containing protein [Pilobolus umbonatus]|nr:Hydroxyethylthiazole kinase family-domain-containing protein [Pilobolus umbonatus]
MTKVDYSLYLVTDRSLVPENKTFLSQITEAIHGGVTLVQLREKDIETGAFLEIALEVKKLTDEYNLPLIINDRVDIALAVDAAGVHIGQDDMPLVSARRILGKDKIIGVSVSTEEEATIAVHDGADYLGIGAVWNTSTKKLKKEPLGIEGVQNILKAIENSPIPTVAIGGIDLQKIEDLMENTSTRKKHLDGVAIVSAIMANDDPKDACEGLLRLIEGSLKELSQRTKCSEEAIIGDAAQVVSNVQRVGPMVHHVTNYVVMNDNANAVLAVGASPIMSGRIEEVDDLAKFNGALLLNLGTLNDIDTMFEAASSNHKNGNPVILDPVGCGATSFRAELTKKLLATGHVTIIKGNAAEILHLADLVGESKGVDSVGRYSEELMIEAVKATALKHGCVVAATGPSDYVSDGTRVIAIENGHTFLPLITGSGCMVSSIVACCAAVNQNDYLLATVAGILIVTIAADMAASRVDGPSAFRTALIDKIYAIANDSEIIKQRAKVRIIE